jgi:arsenate reductase-like glutaredoxin family protein
VRARCVATTRVDIYTRGHSIAVASLDHSQPAADMEVQIFGVKKNVDTRKAMRFFAERRIRTHFVDLAERAISQGELERFIQRFGVESVIDRDSKRYEELGLRHSNVSAGRWVDRILEEPLLLRLPLVRRLGQPSAMTIGLDELTWKMWLK